MKKALAFVVLSILAAGVSFAELPFTLEAAGKLSINGGTNFGLGGGVLLGVLDNVQVRATVLNLDLGDHTVLYLGSGMGLDVLLRFTARRISPYGVAGFHLTTGEDTTNLNLNVGGGVEFPMSGSLTPFAEAVLSVVSMSISGHSDSSTGVLIRGGIRFR